MNLEATPFLSPLAPHQILRPEPGHEDLRQIIDAMSRRILKLTNVTGAAIATLNAVHRAGGYHVFDPAHQDRVQRAMTAIEDAVVAVINDAHRADTKATPCD